MAHGIYETDTMISVGATPWHGLGTILDAPPTAEEAIVQAGLDWEVDVHQNYTLLGRCRVPTPSQSVIRKAHTRADGTKVEAEVLASVGPSYTPVQNRDAFKFFDRWLETGKVQIETAGSLFGGRRIWVLAKIVSDPIVVSRSTGGTDDTVNKYVLLANSHDGTLAVRAGLTPVRVVCNNTLSAAIGIDPATGKPTRKVPGIFRVLHRSNVLTALDNVAETIDEMDARLTETGKIYQRLAEVDVRKGGVEEFVAEVFGKKAPKDGKKAGHNFRGEMIAELFESGVGQDLKGAKGTYWGLYNALTEFTQHRAGSSAENRANNVAFGEAAKINRRGLDAAYILANRSYSIEEVMGEFSDAATMADANHPDAVAV